MYFLLFLALNLLPRVNNNNNNRPTLIEENASEERVADFGGGADVGGSGGRGDVVINTNIDGFENNENCRSQTEQQQQELPEKNKYTKCYFIKSKIFIGFLSVSIIMVILACVGLVISIEKRNNAVIHTINVWNEKLSAEQTIWFDLGMEELKSALKTKIHSKQAKNVILFVGDGMGPNTVTATRIHKYGDTGLMSWEKFPHMGFLKTYCVDRQVPDSTSTATALFGGVKTNYETSGVDAGVHLAHCNESLNEQHHVHSIIKWAQEQGMRTGFVTNTRVMHATPAALYSHTADRRWECESRIPAADRERGCKDIARQLIENEPGKNINVIMGGGRQCLIGNVVGTEYDPIDTYSCYSEDINRNLIEDWKNGMKYRNEKYTFIENNDELQKLDVSNMDHVLGIFANGHLRFDHERERGPKGTPSLKEMVETSIKILSNKNTGFLLVVEGGLIDQAHHRGWARIAVSETSAMDDAVSGAIETLKSEIDNTLIIVTADHTHTLSINGYPKRDNDIFGIAGSSVMDNIPYTTLTYASGGPNGYQIDLDDHGKPIRRDPSKEDTTAYDYVQQVAILTDENTHGGGDVSIHAMGPMAHLFHRVHEQSYVPHVISYAARIGRFRDTRVAQEFFNNLF